MNKKKYRIQYTQTASLDLKERIDYIRYELQEPQTAKKWYYTLKSEIVNLSETPTRFSLVDDEELAACGIRMLVVGNYLVFYIIQEKSRNVVILRILPGRRNWISLLKRDGLIK